MRNCVCAFLAIFIVGGCASVRVGEPTTEHLINPVGVGFAQPRFSWKLISDRPGEIQTAYQIRAASSRDKLNSDPDLWDSGKTTSDQSVLVAWGAKPLESRAQVYWQVRVWDKDDKSTDWSEPAYLELGLLKPATEWKGQWITVDLPRFDIDRAPLAKAMWINAGSTAAQGAGVRMTLNLPDDAQIHTAIIDANADGLVSLYVNGKATLQGPSSHTSPFHADFGQQLKGGKNIIALGALAVRNSRGGGRNAIAAHGVIELESGQRIEFDTDGSWKATIPPSPPGRGRGGPPVADTSVQWYAPDYDESKLESAKVVGPYTDSPPVRSADGTIGPGRYLRKTFTVKGPVAKARLYATALGVYEASINGKPVSDDQLAPGWTDYFKRVMVQTYDVTNQLVPGQPNAIGALLGDGWFAGRLGWMGLAQYQRISDHPTFSAQLEITYADGTSETIATDNTWKGGPGEVTGSDAQLGEVLDARNATAFDTASFDDSAWQKVRLEKHDAIELDPQLGVKVRRLMELTPKKITKMGGMYIVDFGQNMVGHIRLTAAGPAGATVDVLHGEMLNPDGTLYNENLRQAISFDTFTLAGSGKPEVFEPHFTFHGFRYAQITGYPGDLTADNIRGIVVGSDTPDTGTFVTSNPLVNQLASNIRWGQRGNYISVPTDCPQRDERMGWMGDAQVFAPTSVYNADVAGFFTKWMIDVNDGQLTTGDNAGAYCETSPRPASNQGPGYMIWDDAGVIIPWEMYKAYGDKRFLEASYEHMAKYVDYCELTSDNHLKSGGVGDNLAPAGGRGGFGGAPRGGGARGATTGPAGTATFLDARGATAAQLDAGTLSPLGGRGPTSGPAGARGARGGRGRGAGGFGGGVNTTSVLDTAYFAHSAQIVSKAAAILGKTDDAAKYDKLFHEITAAFDKAYIQPDGSMAAGSQSTYVVAFQFGLVPDNMIDAVAKHLTDDIDSKGHLSTGFVGVGYLEPALTQIGRQDLAYKLLLTDTNPSWLFPVKEGATTVWERWDGYTPERGFQTSSMNSFNHYSLGAVGKWLYSGMGGIQIDDANPGFKHFVLAPQISSQFPSVKVTLNSPYGVIASGWTIENGQVTYDATVPPNSSATLVLPSGAGQNGEINLQPGTYHYTFPAGSLKF